MAYRLKKKESVEDGVRRIALEQIGKAIEQIEDSDADRRKTVHEVRKRCKKLRGLVRLVRPEFDDYSDENKAFRDAARELSHVRDADAVIECIDALGEWVSGDDDAGELANLREQFEDRREAIAREKTAVDEKLDAFRDSMKEAADRVAQWSLDADGFSAVGGGLKKTYRRARKAMEKAYEDPTTERFHEWRKRVKYHWYHTRLLRNIWKKTMKPRARAAHDLSDLLGDDHDLAVLHETLHGGDARFEEVADLNRIDEIINLSSSSLRTRARPLGKRVLAEKPQHITDRFGVYWDAWHAQ